MISDIHFAILLSLVLIALLSFRFNLYYKQEFKIAASREAQIRKKLKRKTLEANIYRDMLHFEEYLAKDYCQQLDKTTAELEGMKIVNKALLQIDTEIAEIQPASGRHISTKKTT